MTRGTGDALAPPGDSLSHGPAARRWDKGDYMIVTFYTMSKRRNSTAVPSSGAGTAVSVQLKEPCPVAAPSFIITDGAFNLAWNYCYVAAFGRYYFLEDLTFLTGGRVQADFTVDVLATYRAGIRSYSCFVERAASSYNTLIPDGALSSTTAVSNSVITETELSGEFESLGGSYILRTVAGGDSTGILAYLVSATELTDVLDFMFDEDNFSDVLSDTVTKTFFNPFQYIVDLRWIPAKYSKVSERFTNKQNVKFGWWSCNTSVSVITGGFGGVTFYCDRITMPDNPYSDWRRYSDAFSSYAIYLPGVGTINLSAQETAEGLCARYQMDITTGRTLVSLYTGSMEKGDSPTGVLISTYLIELGVPIQIGQLAADLGTTFSSAVDTAKSIATGNLAGAVSGTMQGIQSALQPTPSVNGTNGARFILDSNRKILVALNNLGSAEYPTPVLGRPLCRNLTLGTLSGYVQCAGASFPNTGYDGEKQAIDAFLNGGFYME